MDPKARLCRTPFWSEATGQAEDSPKPPFGKLPETPRHQRAGPAERDGLLFTHDTEFLWGGLVREGGEAGGGTEEVRGPFPLVSRLSLL